MISGSTKSDMRAGGRFPKGFTLIELLVVIAILALLLSIILPSLTKAKEFARRTVCLSHLGQLSIICVTYAHENDDWFPDYNVHPGPSGGLGQSSDARMIFDGANGDGRPVWVGYIDDYTVEVGTDIFYCPSDRLITRETHWGPNVYWHSYAYWGNFGKDAYYGGGSVWASIIPPARKTTTLKTNSANVPLFGDRSHYTADFSETPWLVTHTRSGRSRGYMSEEATGMNSNYADGSARWCKYRGDKSDEFSAIKQWQNAGINIDFWGTPRVFEKEGYGLPEDLP